MSRRRLATRGLSMSLLALAIAALAACVTPAPRPEQARVIVFGGTGMLGNEIVRALVKRGNPVTVFVRPESNRRVLEGVPVSFVVGDVTDARSVAAALGRHRFDVAISAIARTDHDRPTTGPTLYAAGNDTITRAATAAGVRQLIQLGSVGSGDSAPLIPERLREFSRVVYADKTRGEQTLVASGLRYTIVRTGALLAGGASGTGQLTEDHTVLKPMRIGEVGRVVADCVAQPRCYDRIYHTVDPALPELSEAQQREESRNLGRYKRALRGEPE